MAFKVEILPAAAEYLASLPAKPQRQIARKIDTLEADAHPPGSKALKGKGKGLCRLRSGDYRILYRVEEKVLLVLVVKIGDRKDLYRGL